MLTNNKILRLLSFSVLISLSAIVQATTLSFGSISQTGDSLSIEVNISELNFWSAPSLSTYDLDIQFDPSYLAYNSTRFGDPVIGNQLDFFDFELNGTFAGIKSPGILNIFELSLDSVEDLNDFQVDSFTLAILNFDVLKGGNSELQFSDYALGDASGDSILASLDTATVSTVPVPAAFWLMLSSLTFLYGRKIVNI